MNYTSAYAGPSASVVVPEDFRTTPELSPTQIVTAPALADAFAAALNAEPKWEAADTALPNRLYHQLRALPVPTALRLQPMDGLRPVWLLVDPEGAIMARIMLRTFDPAKAEKLASTLARLKAALDKLEPLQSLTRQDGFLVDWEDADKNVSEILPQTPTLRVISSGSPYDLRRHMWRVEPVTESVTILTAPDTLAAWRRLTEGKHPVEVFATLVQEAAQ